MRRESRGDIWRMFRRDLPQTWPGRKLRASLIGGSGLADDGFGCIGEGDYAFGFGVGGADRLQQQVAEFGESGGLLAGDAALRQQAKNLAQSAVHAGGGREIAGGGKEFGEVEGSGFAAVGRVAE